MTAFKTVTDRFSVAPQISVDDVAALAELGFSTLICNRPDYEDAGQPTAQAIAAAAAAEGLTFHHIPVAGGFTQEAVAAMAGAIEEAGGAKVFAYCRSGTRSANLWALARASAGAPSGELIAAAAGAGYDLRPMTSTLDALAAH